MKILLCEDERRLSDALVTILKHHKIEADPVYDGQEALNKMATFAYDAIVLDIMMPKVDGLEVLQTLRADGNSIPIIMLTAKAQTDDIVTALDMGANDYLVKPFDSKVLVARLRAITRRMTNEQTPVLSFGDVTLNQVNFELSSNKGSVVLSNKEFQLMEVLMLNPNQVFSTERLMDKIWGYDSSSEINVVWVHISALRRRIEEIGGSIIVKAKRNMGYSLKEK